MTAKRETLSRWSFPRDDILQGEVFPSGNPRFAPFPTVTDLLIADFCPVALLHDLLHGRNHALLGEAHYEIERRGDLFHKFIARLKLSLIKGELRLSGYDILTHEAKINSLFYPFAKRYGFDFNACSELWGLYIGLWVRRKLENKELQNISADDETFFEFSVANYYVPFPYESGKRSYPLRGRIDEIDIKRKRIIERTIKGSSLDDKPPILKDYQVWLLWKLLCSLRRGQLPSKWSSINFQDFELVVETPYKDFIIPHENPNYIEKTHSAYAWIHDISISESHGVNREVYEAERPDNCTGLQPNQECGLIRTCYPRNYPHPQCRPEIKQIFKPWYQYLLWEQIWKGDLFQYQLLRLKKEELVEKGLILEGEIAYFNDSKIELEMNKEIGSVRGYDEYTIIPFGTLFCGKEMKAKLLNIKGNRLIMEIQNEGIYPSRDAILLPGSLESFSPIFQEPPTFLEKQKQTGLLKLQQSGAIKEEKAKSRSWIQLLEAIFGIRLLKRGSK
ncbi:MAG: hypothetical protein COZ67_01295 [Chloroflexi bacterium CG_4_8_14_3_um_filter_45_15]|nr:MAG: hypothetical protein COZ67_01295 [Chloroflexi bacterium CG_4_8_14_3_um_filter_45_15]